MKKLSKKTTREELDNVKEGDEIHDETGKHGEVSKIEVINRKLENHYYYKLKNDGTILIIK